MKKTYNFGILLTIPTSIIVAFIMTAFYPRINQENNNDGTLREYSDGDSLNPESLTCVTDYDSHLSCTATTNGGVTYTTPANRLESKDNLNKQTVGNTSDTLMNTGDQTSILQ